MKIIILLVCFFPFITCAQSDSISVPPESEMVSMNDTKVKYGGQYGQRYFANGSKVPYTGFLYARYDNGQLESVQQFVDGIGNGIWIDYAPDGKKVGQGTLIDNRVEGPVTFFYEDGSIKSKGKYLDWKRPIGLWTFYDRKGNIVSTRRYTR
jgi:antitoxin component YwqK of YwqJK toxin-antitoxin module